MPDLEQISHQLATQRAKVVPLKKPDVRLPRFVCLTDFARLFKQQHPNLEQLPVIWRPVSEQKMEQGCWYKDRWVKLDERSRLAKSFVEPLAGPVDQISVIDAAVKFLENYFGKQEHIFVTDWAPLASVLLNDDGYARTVAYDREKDLIVVNTPRQITLTLNGSDLPEAAVWLVRAYEKTLAALSRIPEGVQRVHVNVDCGEEYSVSASPLVIELRVPNYRQLDPHHTAAFDSAIDSSFERALANRRTG